MTTRAIHQLTPHLAYGDAVGNQIRAVRDLLREWGYVSDIFSESWDARSKEECLPFQSYSLVSHRDNILIHHYVGFAASNYYLLTIPDHPVIYYHNITPDYFFFRTDQNSARLLRRARGGLTAFAHIPAIAGSSYNQQELEWHGFQVLGVAPYMITFEKLERGLAAESAARVQERFHRAGLTTWLYVGRLAPNKCIQDIIRTFYYYHRWISPLSQLLLLGGGAEPSVQHLRGYVTNLGLEDAVIFVGHVATEDLAAFYKLSDLYVSMSEHEGFCVPLIEAMHFDLPVLAYASTGVPFAMGNAGVRFSRKDFPIVAELAHEILTNAPLRANILANQRARVGELAPNKLRAQFHACLEKLENYYSISRSPSEKNAVALNAKAPFIGTDSHSHLLVSCQCTQAQLESQAFQEWAVMIKEKKMHLHRKVWEYCYIAQALYERGMLREGRRGLGFAVGQEPLPCLFASLGCTILGTDLDTGQAQMAGWVDTNQHAQSFGTMNKRGICADDMFRQLVSFRFLDMRKIPIDLGTFDFIWSACSLEHLGSLELGEQFIFDSLRLLKPGGMAVHTTEFNVSSDFSTIEKGGTVIYRKRDLERIARRLKSDGYEIELDFSGGNLPADRIVETPPFKHEVHLKLELEGFIVTSFGLIVSKSK